MKSFSLGLLLLLGGAWPTVAGQAVGAVDLGVALVVSSRVAIEISLKSSFEMIQAAARDPVKDEEKFRKDPVYREAFQRELEEVALRRKQLALGFLDRFGKALDSGVGLFYRGMALKDSGEPKLALAAFTEFRMTVRKHPRRLQALMETVDCLLMGNPGLEDSRAHDEEKTRLRKARRFLKRAKRDLSTPDQEQAVVQLEKRLQLNVLRSAYFMLVRNVKRETRDAMLEAINKDLTLVIDPVLAEKLGFLELDEEAYHDLDDGRLAYWSIQRKMQRRRKEAVRDFFRAHRKALAEDCGQLWQARAFKLAGDDDRAVKAYMRFLDQCPGEHGEVAARLEAARLLIHDLNRPDDARRILAGLSRCVSTPDQEEAARGLNRHLDRELAGTKKLDGHLNQPLKDIPLLDRVGAPDFTLARLDGEVAVIVFYATWCTPSRDLLMGLGRLKAEKHLAFQVVGVTRFFGFGWEATECRDDVLQGKFAGKGLTRKRERELSRRLREAGSLAYPLVFTDEDTFERFGIQAFPTILVVDAKGTVRHVATGSRWLDRIEEWVKGG